MKLFRFPQILVFLACLVIGRFMGIQHAAHGAALDLHQAPRQSTHPVSYEKVPVDQVNFLIIKVDSLKSEQPRLENLWWLLHKRQGSLNLVSIYPSLNNNTDADAILQSSFSIHREADGYQMAQSFELLLESQELKWQGFLILDETAFHQVLGDQPSGTHGTLPPLPFPEPASQLVQWRLFCRKNLQSSWQTPARNPWVSAFDQHHLSFGPASMQGLEIWQQIMSDTPANTCTFPVLDNKFHY